MLRSLEVREKTGQWKKEVRHRTIGSRTVALPTAADGFRDISPVFCHLPIDLLSISFI